MPLDESGQHILIRKTPKYGQNGDSMTFAIVIVVFAQRVCCSYVLWFPRVSVAECLAFSAT